MKNDQSKLMDETLSSHNPPVEEEEAVEKTPEEGTAPTEETSPEETPEAPEVTAEEEIGALFANDEEEPEEPEEEPETSEEPEEGIEPPEGLTEDQFDEIISSKESFEKYISRVRGEVMKEATDVFRSELNTAKEEMLSQIPKVVGKASEEAVQVKQETTKFFDAHPYLRERRPYVRDMVARISTDNPEMTVAQVLSEVGKRAERDFSAYEQAQEREGKRKPTFAGAGGRRAPSGQSDTRTKQERLLDSTFS